jgi:hypothetical protein
MELHIGVGANTFLQPSNLSAQRSFDALGATLASSDAADVGRVDSQIAGYTAVQSTIESDPVERVNYVSAICEVHLSGHVNLLD